VEQKLLGGLTAGAFLRRHWQKRPLLVRRALREPVSVSIRELFTLAGRNDVESRLVGRQGQRWTLEHGPFSRARLARMPSRAWSLLVQDTNHHLEAAERLLRRFAFIPQARLDDVMVSYAAPGGGVGPHWDSYDVFLVQAQGRRRWRLCAPQPFAELTGAPLRIIDGFEAQDEYLLEPGDLLYLPPGWGHEGVALDPCITCSVGFRAPSGVALASAFLDFLAERGLPEAAYRDPDLRPAKHAAQISPAMRGKVHAQLSRLRWTRRDTGEVLGTWLTMPKPNVVFARPARSVAYARFRSRLARATVRLDPKTLMLHDSSRVYLNGEAHAVGGTAGRRLRDLADARLGPGRNFAAPGALELVYDWHRSGFLHLS
jgi:50S ribosomal protein L16 3-hydroxylase